MTHRNIYTTRSDYTPGCNFLHTVVTLVDRFGPSAKLVTQPNRMRRGRICNILDEGPEDLRAMERSYISDGKCAYAITTCANSRFVTYNSEHATIS